jgi:hypothetical protein
LKAKKRKNFEAKIAQKKKIGLQLMLKDQERIGEKMAKSKNGKQRKWKLQEKEEILGNTQQLVLEYFKVQVFQKDASVFFSCCFISVARNIA